MSPYVASEKSIKNTESFKTIINGLLYLLSGEESLDLEQNKFSSKSSKKEAQEKIYTKKKFVSLGKNVKFLREYEQDGYYWAPFFRKRPGAESGLKTVYVKGHFKYFKHKGELNDQ